MVWLSLNRHLVASYVDKGLIKGAPNDSSVVTFDCTYGAPPASKGDAAQVGRACFVFGGKMSCRVIITARMLAKKEVEFLIGVVELFFSPGFCN